jgi:hypothetical protein
LSLAATVLPPKFRACILGCLGALVWGSSQLTAQIVQLRPQAGLSLPTRISIQDGVLHVRQKVGFTVGARLTVTFNQRFDAVTGVTYVPGYATFSGAGKHIKLSTSSHVLSGATGARYWVLPPERALSWEIHTSVGLVFGGSPAYQDLFESSTLTGVLGTTLRYQIGQIVSLQLRVQERLYRFRFGNRDSGSSKRPLQVAFGLGLPFLESMR